MTAEDRPPRAPTGPCPGLALCGNLTSPSPLDHADPAGPRSSSSPPRRPARRRGSVLVYLQGEPGSEAPRPLDPASPPWAAPRPARHACCARQRGTGRSTPRRPRRPAARGAIPAPAPCAERPDQQATTIAHFRASDRGERRLCAALDLPRWSLLGRSFSGFTTLRYLSPPRARRAWPGGLTVRPPMDQVYATTWEGMIAARGYWAPLPRRPRPLPPPGRRRAPRAGYFGREAHRRRVPAPPRPPARRLQGAERLPPAEPRPRLAGHDLAALPFSGRNRCAR